MSDENRNKKEKIYHAITEISEKYIDEAADYSFEKHVSRKGLISMIPWKTVGTAAALILVAGGIIALASYLSGKGEVKDPSYVTTTPYESTGLTPTEADPTTTTTVGTDSTSDESDPSSTGESRISDPTFGSDVKMAPSSDCSWDEWVPGPGEVNMCSALVNATDNESDPNARYAVDIEVIFYDDHKEAISVEQYPELIEEKMRAEEKRMIDLGYDMYRVTKSSCGYSRIAKVTFQGTMTREQLIWFTSDPSCGYYMCWIPKEEA